MTRDISVVVNELITAMSSAIVVIFKNSYLYGLTNMIRYAMVSPRLGESKVIGCAQ